MQFLHSSQRTALIYKHEKINYQKLIHHIYYYSSLYEAGAGERIAICAENRPEWVYAFYSGWVHHGISVPVDILATAEEIAYVLQDCRPVILFTSRQQEATVREAAKNLDYELRIMVFEDIALPEAPAEDREFTDSIMDDTAVLVYTSGTTGTPKGVMLSYDNLYANMHSVSAEVPIYIRDDRVMALLPLHHVLPLQGTLTMPLLLGATVVFSPSMVASDILETLHDEQVTLFLGVPRLFVLLRDGILAKIKKSRIASALFWISSKCKSIALSRILFSAVQKKFGGHIRFFPCGGAAMDPQVEKDFNALGFEMLFGYGMTETAPIISFTHPGHPRLGSVGQVMPCNEVRIVDGEVTVRGKNIMKGYFGRPEETAAVMKDGWLYTGDLGYVDEDNYLFLTGRKKEIIVLPNGKNINPDEVEQKFMTFADNLVAEAAVVPSGDALQVLILPNTKEITARGIVNIEETIRQEVISKYNQNSSSFKRILKCSLISDPLPRTRLGKIQRHKLAGLLQDHGKKTEKKVQEPQSEEYRVIRDFLKDQTGMEVYPDDHFELDLNLDSLSKISFQVYLSGVFGIDINEHLLMEHPTPARLAAYLQTQDTTVNLSEHSNWAELFREKVNVKLPESWFTHQWLNRISSLFLHIFFKFKGQGVENIPEGACILTPNHQSYLDGLLVSAYLRKATLKNTYFYAKADHVKSWWKKSMARHHNVIVMDLNNNLKLSLQKLAAALRNGKKIIIFPEGTRTLDGSLGTFKKTFAILSKELNVPIIPVAIKGAFEALPRGRFLPRFFRRVSVSFLPQISPDKTQDYSSLVNKVETAIGEKLEDGKQEQ